MHAEDKDASGRLVQSHAPNEVQAPKYAALHAEIDDDHVGTVATEKPVAGGHLACLQHGLDTGVFQHAPQPLQHDRMVINDQNARHTGRSSYEKILRWPRVAIRLLSRLCAHSPISSTLLRSRVLHL